MTTKQKLIAAGSSFIMGIISLIAYPTASHAAIVVEGIKCEALPNNLWTPSMAKAYAKFWMKFYGWNNRAEFKALDKLWTAESHWNPMAYNHEKTWDGYNAAGIAQIVGTTTRVPAPLQIETGLEYISKRYKKPSIAWAHERKHGWY
jgi:hypothetical protein